MGICVRTLRDPSHEETPARLSHRTLEALSDSTVSSSYSARGSAGLRQRRNVSLKGTAQFTRSELSLLKKWLAVSHSKSNRYHHLHLVEDSNFRQAAAPLLARYLKSAHKDARQYFQASFSRSADARAKALRYHAMNMYPAACDALTVKGFFGEVIAGFVAEVYQPHNYQWLVPAFCFRFMTICSPNSSVRPTRGETPEGQSGAWATIALLFTCHPTEGYNEFSPAKPSVWLSIMLAWSRMLTANYRGTASGFLRLEG